MTSSIRDDLKSVAGNLERIQNSLDTSEPNKNEVRSDLDDIASKVDKIGQLITESLGEGAAYLGAFHETKALLRKLQGRVKPQLDFSFLRSPKSSLFGDVSPRASEQPLAVQARSSYRLKNSPRHSQFPSYEQFSVNNQLESRKTEPQRFETRSGFPSFEEEQAKNKTEGKQRTGLPITNRASFVAENRSFQTAGKIDASAFDFLANPKSLGSLDSRTTQPISIVREIEPQRFETTSFPSFEEEQAKNKTEGKQRTDLPITNRSSIDASAFDFLANPKSLGSLDSRTTPSVSIAREAQKRRKEEDFFNQKMRPSKTHSNHPSPIRGSFIGTRIVGSISQRPGNTCPSNAAQFLTHIFQRGSEGMGSGDIDTIIKDGERFFDEILSPERTRIREEEAERNGYIADHEYQEAEFRLLGAKIESAKEAGNPLTQSEIDIEEKEIRHQGQLKGQEAYRQYMETDKSAQIPAEDVLNSYRDVYKNGVFGETLCSPGHFDLSEDLGSRINHFKEQFQMLEEHAAVFKRVGATVTCNGGTYAMAIEKNKDEQFQYLIFDSHGHSNLNEGKSSGYAYITTDINDAAKYLERVIPYQAPPSESDAYQLAKNALGIKPSDMTEEAYENHIRSQMASFRTAVPGENRVAYCYQSSEALVGE